MNNTTGIVLGFAPDFVPQDWSLCDGKEVSGTSYTGLRRLLGSRYGGDGIQSVGLPSLSAIATTTGLSIARIICLEGGSPRGALTVTGEVYPIASRADEDGTLGPFVLADGRTVDGIFPPQVYHFGPTFAFNEPFRLPYLEPLHSDAGDSSVPHYISVGGTSPRPGLYPVDDSFLGQVRLFPTDVQVSGWLPCDGGLLGVREFSTLYSLLRTRFGGDGKQYFALPNIPVVKTPQGSLNYQICIQGFYPIRS